MSEATGLERLRNFDPAVPVRTSTASGWQGLNKNHLKGGSVLACDQSLNAFGWVYVVNDFGGCRILRSGVLTTSDEHYIPGTRRLLKGHGLSLEKGVDIHDQFGLLLRDFAGADVVFETPPAGGKMARPESSLLSALALKIACKQAHVEPLMRGAQPAKKLFTGDPNSKKPVAHRAMMHQVSGWVGGIEQITNEGKRDALMLALAYLAED